MFPQTDFPLKGLKLCPTVTDLTNTSSPIEANEVKKKNLTPILFRKQYISSLIIGKF